MKSATVNQFHEFLAKLLTGLDYTQINFDKMQEFIKKPELAASQLIAFFNSGIYSIGMQLAVQKFNSGGKIFPTLLQEDDELVFDTQNHTVTIHRKSLVSGTEHIMFRGGKGNSLDDKRITYLTDKEEILKACLLLASFHGLEAQLVERPHIVKEMVYIKLV